MRKVYNSAVRKFSKTLFQRHIKLFIVCRSWPKYLKNVSFFFRGTLGYFLPSCFHHTRCPCFLAPNGYLTLKCRKIKSTALKSRFQLLSKHLSDSSHLKVTLLIDSCKVSPPWVESSSGWLDGRRQKTEERMSAWLDLSGFRPHHASPPPPHLFSSREET